MKKILFSLLLILTSTLCIAQLSEPFQKLSDCINYFMEEQKNTNITTYTYLSKTNPHASIFEIDLENAYSFPFKHFVVLKITKFANGLYSKIEGSFYINATEIDKVRFQNIGFTNYYKDQKLKIFCYAVPLGDKDIIKILFDFEELEHEGRFSGIQFRYYRLAERQLIDGNCNPNAMTDDQHKKLTNILIKHLTLKPNE
jgi:hypothetical protein